MNEHIEKLFPKLCGTIYHVTSPADESYNCIAWATDENSIPWWPADPELAYWPESVPREVTLDAFRQAFATLGYELCTNASLEPGFEKIAVFANEKNSPTHAARQLPTGFWTSKLGVLEDIEHDLRALEGTDYGIVAVIMRRPISNAKAYY